MAFDIETWKTQAAVRYQKLKDGLNRESAGQLYAFLSVTALWPVLEAMQRGDFNAAITLASLTAASLGTNLLANQIQGWKDEASAVKQVSEAIQRDPALRAELDLVLQKLDAISSAERNLSDVDKAWFANTLQKELKKLGSGITYSASVTGGGAVAQGNGAKAVGAGGVLVDGGIHANRDVILGDQFNIQQAPDPREIEREKNEAARQKYLQKLRRHCQSLPLAALGGEENLGEISLDDVYIDLNTTLTTGKDGIEQLRKGKKIAELSQQIEREMPDPRREREEMVPVTLLDAAEIFSRIVILGQPGAGKSTFVKKLLAWQSAALLGECPAPTGIAADLLPVLVILRDLSPRLHRLSLQSLPAERKAHLLADVVFEQVREDLRQLNAADFWPVLEAAFEQG